jgi:hypothetical protein
VQLADPSFTTAHASFVPSLAGETNERNISLSDGSTPPNYMYCLNHTGRLDCFSGHIDPTFCAGVPCFISDVVTTSSTLGDANAWTQTPINYGLFSRNPANNPGPHQALWYALNLSPTCGISGSPDCSIAPVLQAVTLQYSLGTPNCSAPGVGCVTAASTTNLYAINTCPDYAHLYVGNALAVASQIQIDNFDNIILFSLGGAGQGNLGNHSVYAISLTNGTCAEWNTAGTTGTNLAAIRSTAGHTGSGYAPGDTGTFTEAAGVCSSTYTITSIGGGGSVPTGGVAILSGAASGCYLARGFAATATSGSGIGLQVDVTAVGTSGTFETTWAPVAPCAAGNNTTISPTCGTPVTSTFDAYGIHNCSMQSDGLYAGCSGWGPTGQGHALYPATCPVGACDFVDWQIGTATLAGSANSSLNGHGARGYAWSGNAANPNFWESKPLAGTTDATCSNPLDCYKLYTLPTGCGAAPGGSQVHSTQPTLFNDDSQPVLATSSINSPGIPTQLNPPGFTCAFGQQSLFTIAKSASPGAVPGVATWRSHHYENTNNFQTTPAENFEGADNIMACSPDAPTAGFCILATDQNTNFPGNTGLGVDNTGSAAFVGSFSATFPSSASPPVPSNNAAPSAPSFSRYRVPNPVPELVPDFLLYGGQE